MTAPETPTAMEPTDVTLLRRAAALIRERAHQVPTGPWHVEYLGSRGYPQRIANDEALFVAQTYEGGAGKRPLPEHIACWSRGAALDIANLLEEIADAVAAQAEFDGGDPEMTAPGWTYAVQLAKRIAGGGDRG